MDAHTDAKYQVHGQKHPADAGKPRALKGACVVCAVRRVVVSLLQAGGMREEIPGLSVYLDVKAEGDKSRLRKRCILEGVVE